MQAYSRSFAKVYNFLWKHYAERISPLIYEFYESTPVGKAKKSLLDIGCGTGQLALYFLEKGYHVVGLDLSEGMLEWAREKTQPYLVSKQVHFVKGDAACFEMRDSFGLAVSTFDALNHLPDLNSLIGCFQSTYQVLLKGGYFIFDLNTAYGLKNWNSINVTPREDFFLVNRGIYDEFTERAWTKITGFVRNDQGLYERFDETVFNSVFEMQTIQNSLLNMGFEEVYMAKGEALESQIMDPESESKVFFIARK